MIIGTTLATLAITNISIIEDNDTGKALKIAGSKNRQVIAIKPIR